MLKKYLKFYEFIAIPEVLDKGIRPWQIHSLICTMLTTGVLMWGYAIVAYSEIYYPIAGIVGFSCSFIHMFSPLAIRWLRSISIPSFLLIGSGLIHQATYAYFSGGFSSNILIWFGILPMLGGVIEGNKGTLKFFFYTMVVATFFLFLELYGPDPVDYLTPKGRLITQAMMVFGWIFLSTAIIYVFNVLMKLNEDNLEVKNQKIRSLLKILSHDLSNPIIIITQRLKMGLKEDRVEIPIEKYRKIENILENLRKMIFNLREYEEVESGNKDLELTSVNIVDSVQYVLEMFSEQIRDKNITIKFFLSDDLNPIVFAEESSLKHQVLSNIISNAIKFSHKNSEIIIKLTQENDMTMLEVIDSGIGIPDYLHETLFEMSFKTSRRGTEGETGSGFGLPIAKTYVKFFKGDLKLCPERSKQNKTCFILKLRTFRG
ncbi:MAG: HAMP domain-containing histidine kinase [Oligoflexia bacterium]|nr:HAMP domain-containing histidine kinase [Oligoflexia bacterium]